MKKRIKLASKRRVIVFMLVASVILSIPVSAEYWFKFVIRTTTEGYNDEMGAQNKIAGYPYASVIVHHVTAAGQNVTGRRTNFIVITKNTGRQISDNVIIQDCNGGILTYNDVAYNGNVYLRANTGGTHPHYTVQGSWNPNDHGAD